MTLQIFYVDLTVLQTLPWTILTSVCELSIIWQKLLHWQQSYQFWEKNIFRKPKFCTFREILIFQSHSTDGKRSNSKPNTSVKLDIINWQNVKKNVQFQIWMNDLPSIFYIWAGKLINANESKSREGQHLNGNLTMPKTEKHPGKPWFSKHTSEEIILGLRTRYNIWCITVGDSHTVLQNN